MTRTVTTKERLGARIFKAVHNRNLIYNTCWEDPALDRVALDFQPGDRVLVITSAGCNALDYLIAGAGEVNAVDMNPIQNALLELKAAGIRRLDHTTFFEFFGKGRCPSAEEAYHDTLRTELSPVARTYWDKHIRFFTKGRWRNSFYFRGTSGLVAKLVMSNIQTLHRLRKPIRELVEAKSVAEQKVIYDEQIRDAIWTPWLRWFLSRGMTMSLLGVPGPQAQQIVRQYPGGLVRFIRDSVEVVMTELPLQDNYFWRVYIQGHYTPECCPEYLKPENFQRLKAGAIDGLKIHTSTVTQFLQETERGISKFVLLDHMDWMNLRFPSALVEEWNAILRSCRANSRVIYRSAGLSVDYLEHLKVQYRGRETELGSLLRFHTDLARELHARDRVHTYGSFYIADLPEPSGD
jgi:S-adenosylmethionine-diacylglycerol 3-amino-3-carboxypropyl transferase